jgi:hypothetical protein
VCGIVSLEYLLRWIRDGSYQQESCSSGTVFGEWCFHQYPTELSSVDQSLVIANLYQHQTIPFEPYLKEYVDPFLHDPWNSNYELEPHVGQWCIRSFPEQLGHLKSEKVPLMTTVDLEPILVHWCLEQFAPELSAEPVTDDALQQLDYTYQQVENQLVGWSLTLSSSSHPSSNQTNVTIIIGLSIALAIVMLILICSVCPVLFY